MHYEETVKPGAERLALGLGWFSIGLGLAELAAPRRMARLIGVPEDGADSVLRAFGAREIANGLAILAQPANPTWLWTRVGGDLLDLSSLGSAWRSYDADSARVSAAAAAVAGVAALDVFCARRLMRARNGTERQTGVRVEHAITINKSPGELYRFWRNFENLPRFMRHLESVQVIDDRQSRWRAKAPAGLTVEWQAEIVEDLENESIAWRSVEGSDVANSGSVRFEHAPGGRGTEVRVHVQYSPPFGALGRAIATLFGEEPEQQVREDLRRFKQLMEAGEIPISEGPGLWRPARPAEDPDEINALAGVRR